jgi:protein-L-isoaspartate(D-aspartate) O-methyltransferase
VLEIGSGSGWLVAIMAHLVGPGGHVTGIEIIPELAAQSQTDLAAAGVDNVTILVKDGTGGDSAGAPFDRVIITAATWDLPAVLFEQVIDGGYVMVPIELRGTGDCQVTLLRRAGTHFVAECQVAGWFVPLVGAGQERAGVHSLSFPAEAADVRLKLPLGALPNRQAGSAAGAFKAFLGRTEPGFTVFDVDGTQDQKLSSTAFGLMDDKAVAVCVAGELVGYGGRSAIRRLARAFAAWTEFGLPGMDAFGLEVWRNDAAPVGAGRKWVEKRDKTALVWSLGPDTDAWRSLLDRAGE